MIELENVAEASSTLRNETKEARQENKNHAEPSFNHHAHPETTFTLPHCPSIIITSIQPSHLPALKRLTTTLLPIAYPDTFFSDAITCPTASQISRIALHTPPGSSANSSTFPIGWIRCSLEPYPEATSPPQPTRPIYTQIYIKALCLLAPYRHLGVAAAMLNRILEQEKELLRQQNVQSIFAHVWESNEEALEWYEKRGFARVELVEEYYRKLRPGGAWLVRKELS